MSGDGQRLVVVGLGHPDRGDDAAGLLVARRVKPLVPAGVTVIERHGDALGLLDDWAGAALAILVDAAAARGDAGRLHRIDVTADGLPHDLGLASTHAFGVAEAVAMARALDALPARLVVYVVEGESFATGAEVSPAVAAAVAAAATRIAAEVEAALAVPATEGG